MLFLFAKTIVKIESVKELTEYWGRNQKQHNLFWEVWKTRQPKLGEVVVVMDDNLVCSSKIQLSNKNIISRAINHLFPLEIFSDESLGDNSVSRVDDDVRPSRKAWLHSKLTTDNNSHYFLLPLEVSRRVELII